MNEGETGVLVHFQNDGIGYGPYELFQERYWRGTITLTPLTYTPSSSFERGAVYGEDYVFNSLTFTYDDRDDYDFSFEITAFHNIPGEYNVVKVLRVDDTTLYERSIADGKLYEYPFHFELEMHAQIYDLDPRDCFFDLNKDGKRQKAELSYTEAWERFVAIQHQLDYLKGQLDKNQEKLGQIASDQNNLNLEVNKQNLQVILGNLLGNSQNSAVTTIPSVANITSSGAETMATGKGPSVSFYTDALEIFNTIGNWDSKLVPLLSALAQAIESSSTQAELAEKALSIKELDAEMMLLSEQLAQQIAEKQAEADEVYRCIFVNAKPGNLERNLVESSGDFSRLTQPQNKAPGSTPTSEVAAVFAKGGQPSKSKTIVIPNVFPFHNDKMPDGLSLVPGTKSSEVIHATLDQLVTEQPVCLLGPNSGNDRVLVSGGSIYIEDTGGVDSVFVYQTSGALASVNDISLRNVLGNTVTLGVGAELFLSTSGVERFSFAEGTYHLVNNELVLQSGDKNLLVTNGSKYVDTIRGSLLPDQLEGLAGNDKLFGGDGDDSLNGGVGNDFLDGGAGADALHGGAGFDTASYSVSNSGVTVALGAGGEIASASGGHATGDIGDNIENLTGSTFSDSLTGNEFDNVLNGGGGSDAITGGGGRDILIGGAEADRYVFNSVADSGNSAATRDIISDFVHLSDKIDLSAVAEFTWRAKEAFTGTAPELRYIIQNPQGPAKDMTIVQADVNGDGSVDFQIQLKGRLALTVEDFLF
jgi:hypothetical protein